MADEDRPAAAKTALPRIFKGFALHLGVLVAAGAIIYFLTSGESSLSDATRAQFSTSPGQLDQIRSDAVWQLLMWLLLSLAASWIVASFWLFSAEKCRPQTPAQGSMRFGLWIVCFFLSLIFAAVIGWRLIWNVNVNLDLASDTLFLGLILVLLSVLIAYYLSTALFVKTVMKRSVPLGGLFPN
jgi:uncharacterized membrane protein